MQSTNVPVALLDLHAGAVLRSLAPDSEIVFFRMSYSVAGHSVAIEATVEFPLGDNLIDITAVGESTEVADMIACIINQNPDLFGH
jgi:hypothetical protein